MSTRAERELCRQQKLAKEHQQALTFEHKVLSPIFANMFEDERAPSFPMTIRQVRDEHGKWAAMVFKIMFKQLVRGGCDVNGKPFKSHWVVNRSALRPFMKWTQLEHANLKTLYEMLIEEGATEEIWVRKVRKFVPRKIWVHTKAKVEAALQERNHD